MIKKMILYIWTQFNITGTWNDAFLASFRERATFATVSVRDCVQAGSPFVVQKYYGHKFITQRFPSRLANNIIIFGNYTSHNLC